jgi:hypothetical protein
MVRKEEIAELEILRPNILGLRSLHRMPAHKAKGRKVYQDQIQRSAGVRPDCGTDESVLPGSNEDFRRKDE